LAAAEVTAAAVGLAPRIASSVRNAQPDALRQAAPPLAVTDSEHPKGPADASPDSASPDPEGAVGQTAVKQAAPSEGALADSSDRPFSRQTASESASQEGPSIEILNADIKGGDGGSKTLQLAIKSRSREPIEVPQVKVQVYFYDDQNGEIVPSKAQVTSRWLSAPVDWKNGKPELLEVRYLSDTADPDVRFAGYVVAIYYRGDLQDCRAEPLKLKTLFKPKYFIGLDEP
jgi:hypothetical protein